MDVLRVDAGLAVSGAAMKRKPGALQDPDERHEWLAGAYGALALIEKAKKEGRAMRRIRFTKTLVEPASGDHPALIYANKGDLGYLLEEGTREGFWAKRDDCPHKFGVSPDEFELLEGKAMSEKGSCLHDKNSQVNAALGYMEDTKRYMLDVTLRCTDCGMQFRFQGCPMGIDMRGNPTVSPDGTELRIGVIPADQAPAPILGEEKMQ